MSNTTFVVGCLPSQFCSDDKTLPLIDRFYETSMVSQVLHYGLHLESSQVDIYRIVKASSNLEEISNQTLFGALTSGLIDTAAFLNVITMERFRLFDFATPHLDFKICYYTPQHTEVVKQLFYLQPLSEANWAYCLITGIVLGLLRVSKFVRRTPIAQEFRKMLTMFSIAQFVMMYNAILTVNSISGTKQAKPFKDLADLATQVASGKLVIYGPRRDITYEVVRFSKNADVMKLRRALEVNPYQVAEFDNIKTNPSAVYTSINLAFYIKVARNHERYYELCPSIFPRMMPAMTFAKGSKYIEQTNRAIPNLGWSNFVHNGFSETATRVKKSILSIEPPDLIRVLELVELKELFIGWFILVFLVIMWFAVETCK